MTLRKPRDLDDGDLVLSFFSLGRDHDIVERVRAAGSGGCAGIGMYVGEYRSLESSGFAPNGLHELLDEHAVCLAEIEVLAGWADPEIETSERYLAVEATAWRMADEFECRYVQAIGPYAGSVHDAGAAFGRFCDRAAEHGLVTGLEFLPFTNIFSASDALEIATLADRANGGVCVDIWHHERGAADLALIAQLPAERIMALQMSDGSQVAENLDYFQDCLTNRVVPGDGEFDVAGFVEAITAAGATVPWSLEVCNDDVWDTDGLDHVERCVDGMRKFVPAIGLRDHTTP
ncbi:MAG: sugar phosphate isomerase/epimerase [Acidobacteria bacterium]|nr:sugar phosphate isomerase/epimerase [Acidobacteriota bacterium]